MAFPTSRSAGRRALSGSIAGSSLTTSQAAHRISRGGTPSSNDRTGHDANITEEPGGNNEDSGQLVIPVNATVLNMTMTQSDSGTAVAVKEAVKGKLFPLVKFITTDDALDFNKTKGICGLILHTCKVRHDHRAWWLQWKSLVKTSLTNHRNNKIKAIKRYYIGKKLLSVVLNVLILRITHIRR